jgi:type III restriction enzyme
VIETKGDERVKDPAKFARLQQWCADATRLSGEVAWKPLYVDQGSWEKFRPKSFADLLKAFEGKTPVGGSV